TLDSYKTNASKGVFDIVNGKNEVYLYVGDSFKNSIALNFSIQEEIEGFLPKAPPSLVPKLSLNDNFLSAEFYGKKGENEIKLNLGHTYETNTMVSDTSGLMTFVWDLAKGIPNMVQINGNSMVPPVNAALKKAFPQFSTQTVDVNAKNALYHDDYLFVNDNGNALDLHKDVLPLKDKIKVQWKRYSNMSNLDKIGVYYMDKKPKYLGGTWTDTGVNFETKEYGRFMTMYDFDPPTITPTQLNENSIRLRISDKLSGIGKIEAYINEEWLLMNYEYKSGVIWAERLDKNKPFEGNLVIRVTDKCNNTQTYSNTIIPKL
ncbi:MAG: hypothetical protein ACRCVT_12630, partial [Leadbetterella sp.]